MTHIFQPLDVTINSWDKKFMKKKYAVWYALQVTVSLKKGLAMDEVDVKGPVTSMKLLQANAI